MAGKGRGPKAHTHTHTYYIVLASWILGIDLRFGLKKRIKTICDRSQSAW